MELDKIGDRMKSIGKAMTVGITLGVLSLGGLAVRSAAQIDSLQRGLTAVTGSAEEAGRQLVELKEVAKLPGLGFEEAIQGAINLEAAGFSAATSERALKAFGNALATVGRGKSDLDGVITALQQIESKGKVSAEEINQLQERLPGIRKAMVAAFGTADTEQLQRMKLSSEEFVEGIIAEFEKLPPVTGGVQNQLENLGDSLKAAANTIAVQLLPAVIPLAEGLANVLSQVDQLNPETIQWGIALATVAAATGPLLTLVGTLTQLTIAIRAVAPAIGAVRLAMMGTGVGLLIGGLALLAGWFIKNRLHALAMKAGVVDLTDSLKGLDKQSLITRAAAIDAQLESLRAQEQILKATGRGDSPAAAAIFGQIAVLEKRIREAAEEFNKKPDGGGGKPPVIPADPDKAEKEAAKKFEKLWLGGGVDASGRGLPLGPAFTFFGARLAENADIIAARGGLGQAGLLGVLPGVSLPRSTSRKPSFGMRLSAAGGLLRQGNVAAAGTALTGSDLAGKALGGLADGAMKLLGVFNPLTLIGEMLKGAFQAIAPAVDALQVPVKLVATAFGTALAPILKALFPVFKLVTIGATYVGQVFFTISGWIQKAVGWLIKSLADFVDKIIPFGDPLKGLSKAGQAMIDVGNGFLEGADALADARDDIKGLKWDEIQKSADNVNRSLQNVPEGFKVALARFRATTVEATRSAPGASSQAAIAGSAGDQGGGAISIGDININGVTNPKEVYPAFRREFITKARAVGGDVYRFALSLPE